MIKKILRNTHYGDWSGRDVNVAQVDSGWTLPIYAAAHPAYKSVYRLDVNASRATFPFEPPKYGEPNPKVIEGPSDGDVVVEQLRTGWARGAERGRPGTVMIYVPRLDQTALDVARDALAEGSKKRAKQVLEQLGPYAGIGSAIVEAQSKMFEKVASGKTSRQLDREIAEFMRGRS